MDRTQLLRAVIGSAAIGVLVSSVVTEIGKWRERVSRREELALTQATELSRLIYEGSIELIKMGKGVKMYPQTMMMRDGHRCCHACFCTVLRVNGFAFEFLGERRARLC